MKLERMDIDDLSGGCKSGKTVYESSLFVVQHWRQTSTNEMSTSVEYNCHNTTLDLEIEFSGLQELDTDEKCLEQFSVDEIGKIISMESDFSYRKGKREARREIRESLGIKR
jgi:hypothetical protein